MVVVVTSSNILQIRVPQLQTWLKQKIGKQCDLRCTQGGAVYELQYKRFILSNSDEKNRIYEGEPKLLPRRHNQQIYIENISTLGWMRLNQDQERYVRVKINHTPGLHAARQLPKRHRHRIHR